MYLKLLKPIKKKRKSETIVYGMKVELGNY